MITKSNFRDVLKALSFIEISADLYEKRYEIFDCSITVDFKKEKITYPEDKGMRIDRHTTDNFSANENFVVLECVDRLLSKGYRPEHIELEKKWSLGHMISGGEDSGFADICVYGNDGKVLFIIECKTAGSKYAREYGKILSYGGQLFSYWQQQRSCKFIILYASDFADGRLFYTTDSVDCSDDRNILALAEKDDSILLYKNAHAVEDLYAVWDETYERRFCGDVVFRDDSVAYKIGAKPLRKGDLKDIRENDKIVNKFEEILRHNSVSDKENAFNRLIALFICKLVDEIQKGDNDEVEFQYRVGTDTYESLQDRLQRLHKEGMEKFMREEIFYVPDTYAEELVQQYCGYKRRNMIEDLKRTLRILKFYTNNDFAFKNVHNEELFYQNGKIVVEVVKLFERYRIIDSSDVQMLGDLFEQLLNKGFKQNEGQFFTPIPITRFIWDSLPVTGTVKKDRGAEYPKIIDYACGAGHFLTQGVEAVDAAVKKTNPSAENGHSWIENRVYGIEKDYRLARVSKISLFMHGAGNANVIFGDGLENYSDKGIVPGSFDILVANPPYAVKAFKSHLKLKNNSFRLLNKITNDGSEIETLFAERISQLLKPGGIAAVILPSSILSNDSGSYTGAREELLQHFRICAITCFGSKTFGATGTNTVVLFLQKLDETPARFKLAEDSADAVLSGRSLENWEDGEIYYSYLAQVECDRKFYRALIKESKPYGYFANDKYLKNYTAAFEELADVKAKKRQKTFKNMSAGEQAKWMNQRFYAFVKEREKEKLMYFAMVYKQTVLIVTAPADNAKQKAFLGYDWSNRKGNEGIVINTPGGMLYDDSDRFADDTLSGMIRDSFAGKLRSLPKYEQYYRYANLRDMIDFSRVEFNKAIKTAVKNRLQSKYPLVPLKTLLLDIIGNTTKTANTDTLPSGSIPVVSQNTDSLISGYVETSRPIEDLPVILFGDHTCCFKYIDFPFVRGADNTQLLKFNDTVIPKYMYYVLPEIEIENKDKYERHFKYLKQALVPVAPLDIQQKIVDECALIDEEYNAVRTAIEKHRESIEKLFAEAAASGGTTVRLDSSELFALGIGKRVLKKQITDTGIPIYSANVNEPFGYIEDAVFDDYSVGTVIWGIDGDWDVSYIPPQTPFYPTDHCGTLRVLSDGINAHYVAFALKAEGIRQRFTRSNRASADRVKALRLTLPDKKVQDDFTAKAEKADTEIAKLNARLAAVNAAKRDVLKKYL